MVAAKAGQRAEAWHGGEQTMRRASPLLTRNELSASDVSIEGMRRTILSSEPFSCTVFLTDGGNVLTLHREKCHAALPP